MKPSAEPLSVHDAISPPERLAEDDVIDWQMRKLEERRKRADEGRFASPEAVRAVISKFVPNG